MEMLKVENMTFTYPGPEKRPALEHLSFEIRSGEFVLLCGESGCGKTTLLRLLKRELAPAGKKEGRILIEGQEQSTLSDREAACKIGFVMQNPENQIVTDKVWHELAFGLENMGEPPAVIRRRTAEMAGYFGIDDWFRKETSDLSGGQKQLLNLAAVMTMQPDLLLLDEPCSQLDPIAASNFIHTLAKINKDLGITIFMTEHRLEEIFPIVDKVMILEDGKLLFLDTPKETGIKLKQRDRESGILPGLPSAFRICYGLNDQSRACPFTIKEGRDFIRDHYENKIRRLNKEEYRISREKKPVIKMKNVCFRYERTGKDVLENVDLTVYEGETVSILGGNGSGKTTLLSVLAGIHRPYSGKVEIFEKNIKKYHDKELYIKNLAFLPQNPQTVFIKMTVLEDFQEIGRVMGYKKEERKKKAEEMASLVGIESLLFRHPYDLSGGEQQKAALGKILLLSPRLLLLDEPTKGMDAGAKKKLKGLLKKLKEKGMTILMVTHDIEFAAETADRCGLFFDHEINSLDPPTDFFCRNAYYTTAANRIAGKYYDNAVTCEDVIRLCRLNKRKES